MEPPIRNVLAVDAGSRCIRLLLIESRFGTLRIVRENVLDLQEEGLVSADELKAHLQVTLADWGQPPIALVIPQQVAVSQIVELPAVPDAEARELIQAETVKLAGANESALVYDFSRVPAASDTRQSFWVTFCQESEIQSRITQLGFENQEFREITTSANALVTAWQAVQPDRRDAVIVHAGAQSTTIVAIQNGVGVFASSFPMGGDFFTRAIARLRQTSAEAAEALKQSTDLLAGEKKLPGFAEIVDGWTAELKRQLAEWRVQHPGTASEISAKGYVVTGGVFEQPGFLEYLEARSGLKFQRWSSSGVSNELQPAIAFEIAFGAGLQSLGYGPQSASLMPANRRAAWKKRLGRQRLEFASAIALTLCFLVLAFGIWQKVSLIKRKQALANKVQAGLETVSANNALTVDMLNGYDMLRPLFERQQMTVDTLQTLALLQQARSNQSLWCVLLADQQSYFAQPPTVAGTNKADLTSESEFGRRRETNSPARPGLIAEVCVPNDPTVARTTLGAMVNNLKRAPVFGRVDLLSEDLRRSMADPKVILPDQHFALALDFATTEFQPAPRRPRPTTIRTPPRPMLTPNTSTNL